MDAASRRHSLESNVRSYSRHVSATFSLGAGHLIFDTTGREYVDFLSGAGALNYGHNDPDMRDALVSYINKGGISMGLDLLFEAKAEFMETFHDLILQPRKLRYKMQFVGPTGTNAVEAAIKLARKVTGKTNVIAFTNGYHGCSLGALAATANRSYRRNFASSLSNVHRAFYDGYVPNLDTADLLDKVLSDPSGGVDDIAAILVEAIQGEGGLNVATPEWSQRIEAVARKHGALLILDEVQSGCGRGGDFFAFEALGIKPDIVTLAKSLSGFGIPMALTLIRPELDVWEPAEHTGTFRGNAHACVTATVALRKFWSDDHLVQRVGANARSIREDLEPVANAYGWHLKGRGLMQGIQLPDPGLAERVQATCIEDGLLIERCGPAGEIMKILPCLTITDTGLDKGLSILRNAISRTVN